MSKPIDTPEILSKNLKEMDNTEEKDNSSEEIDDSEGENSEEENTENESKFVNSARPRNESPNSKKVIQLSFIIHLYVIVYEV